MSTREIHSLNGTRWTSTSAVWGKRAPYGQMGGLEACGSCGPRGLGVIPGGGKMFTRDVEASRAAQLQVSNYVMSQGAYDPARMIEFMASAINGAGLAVKRPQVEVYPLTWTWRFNGPFKIWESVVASSDSGPFQGEEGGSTTGRPTQQDTVALPSRGTVITFAKIDVPAGHNLSPLLGLLRAAKVDATRGSNAVGSGTLRLKTTAVKKVPPLLMAGGSVLGFIIAWNLLAQGSSVGKNV